MNTQVSNTLTKIRCKIIDDIRIRQYWYGDEVITLYIVGFPCLEDIYADMALFILDLSLVTRQPFRLTARL